MKVYKEFILNYATILFTPKTDKYGRLYTQILEKDNIFLVDKGPTDLMDANLNYYGSSLKGASHGASKILGGVSMTPIIVNERRGIYWFPSKSPSKEDCVWFALHHIKNYRSLTKGKTVVTFNNECTFNLEISYYSFDMKVKQAYQLKGKMDERTNEIPSRIAESKTKYHFNRNDQDFNYNIRRDAE